MSSEARRGEARRWDGVNCNAMQCVALSSCRRSKREVFEECSGRYSAGMLVWRWKSESNKTRRIGLQRGQFSLAGGDRKRCRAVRIGMKNISSGVARRLAAHSLNTHERRHGVVSGSTFAPGFVWRSWNWFDSAPVGEVYCYTVVLWLRWDLGWSWWVS